MRAKNGFMVLVIITIISLITIGCSSSSTNTTNQKNGKEDEKTVTLKVATYLRVHLQFIRLLLNLG